MFEWRTERWPVCRWVAVRMRNIRCVYNVQMVACPVGLAGMLMHAGGALGSLAAWPSQMLSSASVLSTALHTTKDMCGVASIISHTPCTLWYLKKLANTVQNLHVPWRLLVDLFSMCTWDASVCKHQQATAFFPLNNAALCNWSAPWPKIDQQLSWLSHTTLWQHSHSVRVLSCFTCECEKTLKPVMLQMTNWHFRWIWYKKLQF